MLLRHSGMVATGAYVGLGSGRLQELPRRPHHDPIAIMVGRTELQRYKATIKGLTRNSVTGARAPTCNRAAIDWIEAQLKSYGCTNTGRLHYDYQPPAPRRRPETGANNNDPIIGPGGSRRRGCRIPEGVNNDPLQQPDLKLRETQLSTFHAPGAREEVYCTQDRLNPSGRNVHRQVLTAWTASAGARPPTTLMESGTALVMELARIYSSPDVRTERRSIRFALWNNGEEGRASAGLAPGLTSARLCRASNHPRAPANIPNRSGLR